MVEVSLGDQEASGLQQYEADNKTENSSEPIRQAVVDYAMPVVDDPGTSLFLITGAVLVSMAGAVLFLKKKKEIS